MSAPVQPNQEMLDAIAQDIHNFYAEGRHFFADLMDPVHGAFAPAAPIEVELIPNPFYDPEYVAAHAQPNPVDLPQEFEHFYLDDDEDQAEAPGEDEQQFDQLYIMENDELYFVDDDN